MNSDEWVRKLEANLISKYRELEGHKDNIKNDPDSLGGEGDIGTAPYIVYVAIKK